MTTPPPPTPDYEAPPAAPVRARRPLATWVMLLLVWWAGLVSWALYGIALVYLLAKVL